MLEILLGSYKQIWKELRNVCALHLLSSKSSNCISDFLGVDFMAGFVFGGCFYQNKSKTNVYLKLIKRDKG